MIGFHCTDIVSVHGPFVSIFTSKPYSSCDDDIEDNRCWSQGRAEMEKLCKNVAMHVTIDDHHLMGNGEVCRYSTATGFWILVISGDIYL